MSHRTDPQQYFEAAKRKSEIARYHTDQLGQEPSLQSYAGTALPTVPVQAHFEGAVVSVMAAVDQVAQAVNSCLRLSLKSDKLVEGAFSAVEEAVPEVGEWYRDPLGRDLRRLRVRMVHYAYKKTPEGKGWAVESTDTEYRGSRELAVYAKAAAQYAEKLRDLIPQIQEHLQRQAAE